MIKRIKRELKKLQKGARGGMTAGSHTHSHSIPGGGHSHTGVTQGHTHAMPHNHQVSGTAAPFYDPSTGWHDDSYEWFHKTFCPCGSIEWIEVSRKWAWSHKKNDNTDKRLLICKECEKVTIVEQDEIVEQRDPIKADNKFDFFEKVHELRIDFEQNQYPYTSTSTYSTTSTTSTTRPPGV